MREFLMKRGQMSSTAQTCDSKRRSVWQRWPNRWQKVTLVWARLPVLPCGLILSTSSIPVRVVGFPLLKSYCFPSSDSETRQMMTVWKSHKVKNAGRLLATKRCVKFRQMRLFKCKEQVVNDELCFKHTEQSVDTNDILSIGLYTGQNCPPRLFCGTQT